ncbi:hypothetical protein GGX14DRAFT_408295 [Mycena pura]|uniref:MYND-type domain-containing protein n=1 Tax=Mycena pura TaxID=153505 RepID=A0AAD6Y1G9_9AGAR|nr:hypothetical protein GGX14DRAFT_408295 [Mycena pura]
MRNFTRRQCLRVAQLASKNDLTDHEFHEWLDLRDAHEKCKPPEKHTDRNDWNTHCEMGLTLCYAHFHLSDSPDPYNAAEFSASPNLPITEMNTYISMWAKGLIQKEGLLVVRATEFLDDGDFETEWAQMHLERKQELVLEALYRGACAAPRQYSRSDCPEMTVAGLTGEGEYNLISLLKTAIASDATGSGYLPELYFFKHPKVEQEYSIPEVASENHKAVVYETLLLRSMYIADTLLGFINAYQGIPDERPTQREMYAAPVRTEERKKIGAETRARAKQEGYPLTKSDPTPVATACAKCRTHTDRASLKRCSRCQITWYCSAECQKQDWKEHKRICGKKNFDPANVAPTPAAPPHFHGCPAIDNGFKRSLALWQQIQCLSQADSQEMDYHVCPHGFFVTSNVPNSTQLMLIKQKRSLSIIFCGAGEEVHMTFLVARRRAMATGARTAVATMLTLLAGDYATSTISRSGAAVTREMLRRQLTREYGINDLPDWATVQAAAAGFVAPTVREVAEEMQFYHERFMQSEAAQAGTENGYEEWYRAGCPLQDPARESDAYVWESEPPEDDALDEDSDDDSDTELYSGSDSLVETMQRLMQHFLPISS